MPEQNLHIFWSILRSGALSLLPYQFALLHVFSVMVVGWYFLLLFLLFFFVIRKNENGLVHLFDIKIILNILNMGMYLMLM